jgi:regulator of cell morphogenesis and NO signaling
MTNISQQTLASIVKENHHAVPVLEKYSLDFCCKGKRSLAEACTEKGLPVQDIESELSAAMVQENDKRMPLSQMTAEQLISHILVRHHFYVKQSMPTIMFHLGKVASKHGDRFPYMKEVLAIFSEVQHEMSAHMQKEEFILFPRIKDLEHAAIHHDRSSSPHNFIDGPIALMEAEHEHAGEAMFRIRELTNNYTAPETACTTFRVVLAELKEFEEDLHEHVHLENNILFPKAHAMMLA